MEKTGAAEAFDAWMAKEYDRQKERLSLAYGMDEDAFHDAYLTVRDALAENNDPDGHDWAAELRNAYAKTSRRHADVATVDAGQVADDVTEDAVTVTAPDRAQLARDIVRQVRKEWPPLAVFVWQCRTVCGMTYADIADASGTEYKRAKKYIDNINGEMRRRYACAIA